MSSWRASSRAWAVVGVLTGFPGWWETVLYSTAASVTVVMVFAIQHTQHREQMVTQRKLDELLRALPEADDQLIAAEGASDDELDALAGLNIADRQRLAHPTTAGSVTRRRRSVPRSWRSQTRSVRMGCSATRARRPSSTAEGSIDWLCLPHFDGDPVFARLLAGPDGGHFTIRPAGRAESIQRRYRPGYRRARDRRGRSARRGSWRPTA